MIERILSGLRILLAAAAVAALAGIAAAQESVWVQIEAERSLPDAEARAADYEVRLDNVQGFRLSSGWHAIALGPYTPDIAALTLARLRAGGLVPRDSFIADGSLFREQFWPPGASGTFPPIAVAPLPDTSVPEAAPLPVAPAPDAETLADARAAERLLSRTEKEEIQRALQWDGFYRARIDGSFGPGTRRAIEDWQASKLYPITGVLMTAERLDLIETYRTELASLGFAPVRDIDAGIEMTMPAALIERTREEAPFIEYGGRDGSGVQVLLISQPGDQATLVALYEILQTLEIVPLTGPRELRGNSFTIAGENAGASTFAFAEARADAVKGFVLVWPQGDEKRRQKAIAEMRASFTPLPGIVLPDQTAAIDAATRRGLLAGLEIRRPTASVSGFFVDRDGQVLTAAAPVASCGRITLGDDTEMSLAVADDVLGLALLRPQTALAPIRVADFDAMLPTLGAEIAVSGFSYGGALRAPTITFGRIEDTRSLDDREELTRLALLAEDGDVGGPILDSVGAVRGLLLPAPADDARQLPEDVRYATDAGAIAEFLLTNGIEPAPARPSRPLDAVGLAARGADMTVLVQCWN